MRLCGGCPRGISGSFELSRKLRKVPGPSLMGYCTLGFGVVNGGISRRCTML